eukprot:Awhi_evm1s13880
MTEEDYLPTQWGSTNSNVILPEAWIKTASIVIPETNQTHNPRTPPLSRHPHASQLNTFKSVVPQGLDFQMRSSVKSDSRMSVSQTQPWSLNATSNFTLNDDQNQNHRFQFQQSTHAQQQQLHNKSKDFYEGAQNIGITSSISAPTILSNNHQSRLSAIKKRKLDTNAENSGLDTKNSSVVNNYGLENSISNNHTGSTSNSSDKLANNLDLNKIGNDDFDTLYLALNMKDLLRRGASESSVRETTRQGIDKKAAADKELIDFFSHSITPSPSFSSSSTNHFFPSDNSNDNHPPTKKAVNHKNNGQHSNEIGTNKRKNDICNKSSKKFDGDTNTDVDIDREERNFNISHTSAPKMNHDSRNSSDNENDTTKDKEEQDYKLQVEMELKAAAVAKKGKKNMENMDPSQCINCKTMYSVLWRHDFDKNILCNACGLYFRKHLKHRPSKIKYKQDKRKPKSSNFSMKWQKKTTPKGD